MPKRDGGLSVLGESEWSRPSLGEEGHEDILHPVSWYRMERWEKDDTAIRGIHSSSDFAFTAQEMASTFSHISFIWLSTILENQHIHSPQEFKPEWPKHLQEEAAVHTALKSSQMRHRALKPPIIQKILGMLTSSLLCCCWSSTVSKFRFNCLSIIEFKTSVSSDTNLIEA